MIYAFEAAGCSVDQAAEELHVAEVWRWENAVPSEDFTHPALCSQRCGRLARQPSRPGERKGPYHVRSAWREMLSVAEGRFRGLKPNLELLGHAAAEGGISNP